MRNEVPEGWAEPRLGDVNEVVGGTTPSRSEPSFWGGKIPWAAPTDITRLPQGVMMIEDTAGTITELGLNSSSLSLLPPESVLMTSRATIGYAVVAKVPITTNQGFCSFLPSENVVPLFLAQWLRHHTPLLKSLAAGSTFLEINRGTLRKVRIPLPPLPEQKKIATILTAVDEAIQATQAVLAQTRRVKEGLLQDLLTRGIGRDGRPHTRFQQTEIGEIPRPWEATRLGTVAEVRSGIAKNSKRTLRDPIEVAYLRVANVQDGYLALDEIKTIRIERSDLPRYTIRAGDVLMNEGGDIDKLGRGDVWAGQIEPCVHQNHVFSVRCGSRLRPRYLSYLAESPTGKAYFLAKGKQTTNLASINKSQLREFPVPLPPLGEQDQIVERLNSVRAVADEATNEAVRLGKLKAGLLQDLLTGKVRVTP